MSITVKISLLNEDVTVGAAWEVVGDIIVERPSNFLLNLHPDEVTSLIREGGDLVVTLADGRTLRIVDFYIDEGEGHSELYLVDENNGVLWLDLSPAGPDDAADDERAAALAETAYLPAPFEEERQDGGMEAA
ncbi:BapA prefix-like domain-containing protein [Halomonas sp. MCCC 1A11036]|uniref:BapA prefix-like domain-containing protein n=1 Tax=Billgrantia zhangzhouensis TaxID=2733481 RepID=A0ABS9AAF7_9GAMM|nr:BapA prefix-like domain-containing protein [Halomonas zhangzhouensis]MCE8018719.1 BapA prefix-like domain-containing protein [Halomonas zhangzhouensis]